MSLKNKTVLLTGASKGIGKALALKLAESTVNIGLVARSEQELLEIKIEIEKLGSKCLVFVGNVADERRCKSDDCKFWNNRLHDK
jgi:short-subunit dehydrogenase